jgi:hypothetical protein
VSEIDLGEGEEPVVLLSLSSAKVLLVLVCLLFSAFDSRDFQPFACSSVFDSEADVCNNAASAALGTTHPRPWTVLVLAFFGYCFRIGFLMFGVLGWSSEIPLRFERTAQDALSVA